MLEDKLSVILEHELIAIPGATNQKAPVLQNPGQSSILKLMKTTDNIGGILHKKDLYLWDRNALDHESVEQHFVLPSAGVKSAKNPIPFYLMGDVPGGKSWVLKLSPSSWMGVDHKKDIEKVQKYSPLFKSFKTDSSYFE